MSEALLTSPCGNIDKTHSTSTCLAYNRLASEGQTIWTECVLPPEQRSIEGSQCDGNVQTKLILKFWGFCFGAEGETKSTLTFTLYVIANTSIVSSLWYFAWNLKLTHFYCCQWSLNWSMFQRWCFSLLYVNVWITPSQNRLLIPHCQCKHQFFLCTFHVLEVPLTWW